MEELLLDTMYDLPSRTDVRECTVTEDDVHAVTERQQAVLLYKHASSSYHEGSRALGHQGDAALASEGRFIIYGWEPQVHFWRDWFHGLPEFSGWKQRRLGPFADIDAWVFEAGGR